MDFISLLEQLCSLPSVAGHEYKAQAGLHALLAPFFDRYEVDRVGNHHFVRYAKTDKPKKILLDAHFDQIGMLVKEIQEQGFLKVCAVGGLDRRTLPSQMVQIHGDTTLFGIFSSVPPHLLKEEERKTLPKTENLWIDTGYSRTELEAMGVRIGVPVTLYAPPFQMENGLICGGSFDNKACCAIAILAGIQAQLPDDIELHLLLSAKEELGGVGAFCASTALCPDLALVLDANIAKTPNTQTFETVPLWHGPSISHSALCDRRLVQTILDCAKEQGIALSRIAEANGTGTNADSLTMAANGVPCAVLSLPLRHMHTPTELVSCADAQALLSLLIALLEGGLSPWFATAPF